MNESASGLRIGKLRLVGRENIDDFLDGNGRYFRFFGQILGGG